MPKYKQYSPILASNFEQKGQENTTSYNLPYWPCYHGRNVRVKNLLQIYSTKFLDITYKINSPWVCVIKVCSNGGATYIIGEIIAKDNVNIENLMQTFENLLLQNCSTKFLDIAHK